MICSAGIAGGSFEMPEDWCSATGAGAFAAGAGCGDDLASGRAAGSHCGGEPGSGPTSCAWSGREKNAPETQRPAIASTADFERVFEISFCIFKDLHGQPVPYISI